MFEAKNLTHELLLKTREQNKAINVFENNLSTDEKLFKVEISNIIQSGRILCSLLSEIADPLGKVVVPIATNILAPLEITAAASVIDSGIQKKILGLGTTTLII